MAYRANVTDKSQSEIEDSTFSNGAPVFIDGKTRVVAKALHTAPYKTANNSSVGGTRNNAGVVMPPSDTPSRFVSETQGKG